MATDYFDKVYQEDLAVGVDTDTTNASSGGEETVTQIGLHSLAVGQLGVEQTWDPGSCAVGSKVSVEVTVAGAALQDFALASFSLDIQDLQLTANVTAANTVTVLLTNNTAAAVDLGEGTLRVVVLKCRV